MRLYIERPIKSKPGFFRGEWLPGTVSRDDAPAEALALLNDPRDTIVRVKVWNDRWGQFEPLTFAQSWDPSGTKFAR